MCTQDIPPSNAWDGVKAMGETWSIPSFLTPNRHLQVEHYQLYLWLSQLFEYSPSPEFVSLWVSLSPTPKPKGWNSPEQAQTKKGALTQELKKNPHSLHLPTPMKRGSPKFCSFTTESKSCSPSGNSHLQKADKIPSDSNPEMELK